MKSLTYNTSENSNSNKELGISKKTVTLPSIKSGSFEVIGNESYTIITGEKESGGYWGGYFTFVQPDIVTLSPHFKEWQEYVALNSIGGWKPSIVSYLNELTKYDADDLKSVYGAYRAVLQNKLNNFLETEDNTFAVKITQSLQDQKKLELLQQKWSNNIINIPPFIGSYKQGSLPMFVNAVSILSSLVRCATCEDLDSGGYSNPYNLVGSSYPGQNIKNYDKVGFEEASSLASIKTVLIAAAQQAIGLSCAEFVDKVKGDDYSKKVDDCNAALETERTEFEKMLADAESEKTSLKEEKEKVSSDIKQIIEIIANLESEIQTVNESIAAAEKEYNECLEKAATPAEIEACNEAYDQAMANLNKEKAEYEAQLAVASKSLEEAQAELSQIEIDIEIAENDAEIAKGGLDNIDTKTNDLAECRGLLASFCGGEAQEEKEKEKGPKES